jgi:hypothetical protein
MDDTSRLHSRNVGYAILTARSAQVEQVTSARNAILVTTSSGNHVSRCAHLVTMVIILGCNAGHAMQDVHYAMVQVRNCVWHAFRHISIILRTHHAVIWNVVTAH